MKVLFHCTKLYLEGRPVSNTVPWCQALAKGAEAASDHTALSLKELKTEEEERQYQKEKF